MFKRKSRRYCIPKKEKKILKPVMIIDDEGNETPVLPENVRKIQTPADIRFFRQPDSFNLKYSHFGHYAVLGMCSGVDVLHVVSQKVETGNSYSAPGTRFTFSKTGAGIVKEMREMGMDATLYSFCGGDGGELMKMQLDKTDLAYRLVKVNGDTSLGTLICDDNGTETHIQSTSFYVKIREYKNLIKEITKREIPARFVVISGQPPDCFDNSVYQDLVKFFKEKDIKVFLDCVGAPHRLAINEKPDFALIDKKILEIRFGIEADSLAQILIYVKRYQKLYDCEIICDMGHGFVYCGKDVFATAIPERYFNDEHRLSHIIAEKIDFEHVNPARRHSRFIAEFLWAYEYTVGDITASLKIAAAMSRAVLETRFDSDPLTFEQRKNAMIKTNLKIY